MKIRQTTKKAELKVSMRANGGNSYLDEHTCYPMNVFGAASFAQWR
jgi:hypothetical protein